LDVADIDLLSAEVGLGSNNIQYDLNADAVVDQSDRDVWVHDLANTFFGDADLDGEFNSANLINVLAAGQYEDGEDSNSGWLSGDWDGDGDFTFSDLIDALADGGYEAGPRAAAVPEPTPISFLAVATVVIALAFHDRRLRRPREDAKLFGNAAHPPLRV
jgi:hypothetical protein